MELCDKWKRNPGVNPITKRKISPTGQVYKKLKNECRNFSPSKFKKSPRTLARRSKCDKWIANPGVNPITKRKISPTGQVYKNLKKECESKSPSKSFKEAEKRKAAANLLVDVTNVLNSDWYELASEKQSTGSSSSESSSSGTEDSMTTATIEGNVAAMALLKDVTPAAKYNFYFRKAAAEGHLEAMELLKDWGATNYDDALYYAAAGDHLEAMKLLKNWGATRFNWALHGAAKGNKIKAMELLLNFGATIYATHLESAAGGGNRAAMFLLKHRTKEKWGESEYNAALEIAAENGRTEAMFFLQKWGAREYNKAFRKAAGKGHIEAMTMLKKWGADADNVALGYAAEGGHLAAMELLYKWGADEYDWALKNASHEGHLDAMEMLYRWGVRRSGLNSALVAAAASGHIAAMELLTNWGANNFYEAFELATALRQWEAVELLKMFGLIQHYARHGKPKGGRKPTIMNAWMLH